MKEHAERVAAKCVQFSRELGLTKDEVNQIYLAGLFHDIGMVYIPQQISQKSEPLTEEEMDYVKKHPLISEKIISKHSIFKELLPIVRHHHEAVDGSGYPDGLKGDAIPIGAKILGLVNSFDSMTNRRVKSHSMTAEDTLLEIKTNAGTLFDKGLANDFIEYIGSSVPNSEKEKKEEAKEVIQEESDKEVEEKNAPATVRDIINKIMKRFKRGDIDLPVLPKVVHDIQKIMSSSSTTVSQLASVIERDAVISVKLVSVANSPMYRGAEKILTVRQAVPRLGVKETQNIVTTIGNKSLYDVKDHYFKTTMEKLWLHSLASAYIARSIALKSMFGDDDKFFFMGLIHDIGKVLLIKVFADIITRDHTFDNNEVMDGIQEAHTGFGGVILRKWGFAEGVARIALLHEGPKFRHDIDEEILVVNVASSIADNIGYGLNNGMEIDISGLDSIKLLSMETDLIDNIIEETKESMGAVSNIF